jgi:phosphatidylinositol glycan class U
VLLTAPAVQEGLYLYTHNVSPYDGGVYHQAPLLLPLFSLLPNASYHPFATSVLFTVVDLLSAYALAQIADSGQAATTRLFKSSRRGLRWSSAAIAAGYASHRVHACHVLTPHSFLFNPFTLATCMARSTTALTNLFILTAMAKACQGASTAFLLAISAASYLAMHPVLLFPPLLVLLYDARSEKTKTAPSALRFTAVHTLGLVAVSGTLLFASALLSGSWGFLEATYGVRLLLPDLTPNVGLWWYFFTEMFDSFRDFFLGVFWLHVASYTPGLTIRLRTQPLFVATTLTGIFAIFTPYPSVADAALYLSLVPLFRHLFPRKCSSRRRYDHVLNLSSNALYLPRLCSRSVCIVPWAGLLPSLGLRRFGQCQFLLRHHSGMELGLVDNSWRLALCCAEGRVGCPKTGIAGQGGETDIVSISITQGGLDLHPCVCVFQRVLPCDFP